MFSALLLLLLESWKKLLVAEKSPELLLLQRTPSSFSFVDPIWRQPMEDMHTKQWTGFVDIRS